MKIGIKVWSLIASLEEWLVCSQGVSAGVGMGTKQWVWGRTFRGDDLWDPLEIGAGVAEKPVAGVLMQNL